MKKSLGPPRRAGPKVGPYYEKSNLLPIQSKTTKFQNFWTVANAFLSENLLYGTCVLREFEYQEPSTLFKMVKNYGFYVFTSTNRFH